MTNTWQDIKNANVILVMGGNAAEAHPCGFKWVTEAKQHNHAKLVVVDPRFTRTAAVADLYAPIRPGTDIAFLNGVMRYLLEKDAIQREYVLAFTNASLIVKDGFGFQDGLFSGFSPEKKDYDRSSWDYELGEDGFVKSDPTLADPRCVINLLKQHVARYTPETVSRICGTPVEKFLAVCELIASTAAPDKALTSMYALGWTQHSVGSQNIRAMAMIQLLLGNIGVAGGGMNALRGHSNIQGLTDMGLLSNLMPGYLTLPKDSEPTLRRLHEDARLQAAAAGADQLLAELQEVPGQPPEVDLRRGGDRGQRLGVRLPAEAGCAGLRHPARLRHDVHGGKINGYICQGFNPLQSFPNKKKIRTALGKLKFLVVMDPLETETARFWENHGDKNPSDPSKIATEVFLLPTTCFAEEDGSLTNSSRWLQWHWKAADAPGEAKQRHRHHVRPVPAHAGDVPQGRRRVPRSDPQPDAGTTPTRSSRGRTSSPRR